jgi:N-formylmaleamate deformylase
VYNWAYSTANPSPNAATFEPLEVGVGDQCITLRRWPGMGPPLLLVHGIGSSGASWEPLVPALAREFTPITFDLRGHGASGKPASGYLYGDYVDDLDRILDALRLERPLIMGHSLGGIVTLWWAARHPDRAAGLVVVDSPLRSGQEFMPAFDGWLAQNAMTPEDLTAWYRHEHPEWNEERAAGRASIMTGTARNVFVELRADSLANDGRDRLDEIAHITSPVLLVRGEPATGSMVHPEDSAALVARMPNARVAMIPGAGHALHRERPDEFLAIAVPFLQECAAKAGLS